MNRPSWFTYALDIADVVATRSEDPYVKCGAVVLREDMSVAGVGYNGPPSGVDIDWSDRDRRRGLIIHAEVNALRYCRRDEVAKGMVAVSGTPCPSCLTSIAAYGILSVIFRDQLDNYPLRESEELAGQLGLNLVHLPRERTWVCDHCMNVVTQKEIYDMADGEHVLCHRCARIRTGWLA